MSAQLQPARELTIPKKNALSMSEQGVSNINKKYNNSGTDSVQETFAL